MTEKEVKEMLKQRQEYKNEKINHIREELIEKFEKTNNQLATTVKIISEIISVKKDKNENIIEGDPDKIKTVTDYWKFTKSVLSKNPNWFLAEIVSR